MFKKLGQYADLAEVVWSRSKENKLVNAVFYNNTDAVKSILKNNNIDWSQATVRAETLLLSSAYYEGNLTIVHELLSAGIPVNARDARDARNETFLEKVIYNNDKELVKKLISYGAKVNIRIGDKGFHLSSRL